MPNHFSFFGFDSVCYCWVHMQGRFHCLVSDSVVQLNIGDGSQAFQMPPIFCCFRIPWSMSRWRTLQLEEWVLFDVSLSGACLFCVFVRLGSSVYPMKLRLAISVFLCRRRNLGLRFRWLQTRWLALLCCRLELRLGRLGIWFYILCHLSSCPIFARCF